MVVAIIKKINRDLLLKKSSVKILKQKFANFSKQINGL